MRIVQRNAMRAWRGEGEFLKLLRADKEVAKVLPAKELTALFDLGYHLKQVDAIFDRVFGNEAQIASAPSPAQANLQFDVEPIFALCARNKRLVALCRLFHHLFVGLARPGLQDRQSVGADRVAKLPAVAIDDGADRVADDRGRRRVGECGREDRP